MPGKTESTHDPKLSTPKYGTFVEGTTVSRGVTRKTVAIHVPQKGGKR